MKYSIMADNYSINFEEHDNILCLERYFTAKNIEQVFDIIKDNFTFIGIHIRGNNASASGTIKLGGTITNTAIPAQNFPVSSGVSMLSALDTAYGQGNINWWFSNYVIPVTSFASTELKLKIDNTSVFTGSLYIRVFFKLR